MAVDTEEKRLSATRIGLPWASAWPFPDGVVGRTERAYGVYLYALDSVIYTPGCLHISDAVVTALAISDAVVTSLAITDSTC